MDPAEIGRRAAAGVERGDFYIFTHPYSVVAARRRAEEIEAAFAVQAPFTPESERYDVNAVVRRVSNVAQGSSKA